MSKEQAFVAVDLAYMVRGDENIKKNSRRCHSHVSAYRSASQLVASRIAKQARVAISAPGLLNRIIQYLMHHSLKR